MCYDDNARPPNPPGAVAGTASGNELELTASDGNRFAAYLATPAAAATAQVLILPDVRGLHQFYKELALRFAETGVAAIAMDYFGRTAGIGPRDESFEYMPHVQQLTLPTVFADAAASLGQLRAQTGASLASCTVGFCLGGTLSFLCGTEGLGLAGVVGFYAGMSRSMDGRGTLLERAAEIRRPALGLFGGADQGIPVAQVEAFDQALDATGVAHEILIYPAAPHSFFDRRAADFADASADAWKQVLAFIAAQAGALAATV
jgi:carboxymethylenebutenolidase